MNLLVNFWRTWSRGLVVLALALVTYWAALHRPQPLLWLIASVLLAALVTGFIWPRWTMRALHLERQLDIQAQEGEVAEVTLRVSNTGWLPRFMVGVGDHLPLPDATGAIVFKDVPLGLIGSLAPRSTFAFPARIPCEKRGCYQLGPASLSTSFPLDLIEVTHRARDAGHELLVYPALFPIARLPLGGNPHLLHRGDILLPDSAGSVEFKGLREYRPGDNPRHIHWPSSAKGDDLMVREFEALATASLVLVLDLGKRANLGPGRHSSAEHAIRIAASCAHFANTHDVPFALRAQSQNPLDIAMGSGDLHLQQMQDTLARVAVDGDASFSNLLEQVAQTCRMGDTILLSVTLPHAEGSSISAACAAIRARGTHLVAVLLDGASFTNPEQPNPMLFDDPIAIGLLTLGARLHIARRGDDLTQLFTT